MFESRDSIERASRMYAACLALPDNRILCRVLKDIKMYADARDVGIMPHLAIDGFWESWVTKRVADHVKPGMRCWVVGAHWGYYALLMAQLGATVDAFEPNKRSYELLLDNVALNGVEVNCHNFALGEDDTALALRHSRRWSGSSSVVNPMAPYDPLLELVSTVVVTSVDRFLQQNDRLAPQFVFIDAERSEPAIWRGMAKTWADNPGMQACLECLGNAEERGALYDLLRETAFVHLVNSNGVLIPVVNASDLSSADMLWLVHRP